MAADTRPHYHMLLLICWPLIDSLIKYQPVVKNRQKNRQLAALFGNRQLECCFLLLAGSFGLRLYHGYNMHLLPNCTKVDCILYAKSESPVLDLLLPPQQLLPVPKLLNKPEGKVKIKDNIYSLADRRCSLLFHFPPKFHIGCTCLLMGTFILQSSVIFVNLSIIIRVR